MSEYQNFLILSHLSETIDVPAWFTPLPDQAPSRPGTPQDQAPPPRDQAPPRSTPPPPLGADPPLGTGTPPADGYCCGRYAFYWNAFLLNERMVVN